ncbi:carbohydrate sulfotransferase 11 isoform X2 [Lingula anatina]|nr:carbohydrate sulfotransferase 11 isoform X2 [Lingula anatina]XP_013382782.1 carbohydrate sulfotransferase 11 isoform X2 [Lingula anatina]|eukprot:XP_013382781.1 carbohydrate sulfotransferase 11 isoform X2 [Lingula anatina]
MLPVKPSCLGRLRGGMSRNAVLKVICIGCIVTGLANVNTLFSSLSVTKDTPFASRKSLHFQVESDETKILQRRKTRVENQCAAANKPLLSAENAAMSVKGEQVEERAAEHKYPTWIVNDEGTRALYCIVPKTGSTNLRRIFAEVKSRKEKKTELFDWSKMTPVKSWHFGFDFLMQNSKSRIAEILQRPNSIKILSVRHPFERLISLYKMIFEGNRYENKTETFIQKVTNGVSSLIRRYLNRPYDKLNITFPMFIEYIVYHGKCVEEGNCTVSWYHAHWSPIWRMCRVCSLGYDLIMRMETFDQDLPEIFRLTNITKSTIYPEQWKRTSKGSMKKYFSQLSDKLIEDLKEMYKMDFKLFGYDYSKSDVFID